MNDILEIRTSIFGINRVRCLRVRCKDNSKCMVEARGYNFDLIDLNFSEYVKDTLMIRTSYFGAN